MKQTPICRFFSILSQFYFILSYQSKLLGFKIKIAVLYIQRTIFHRNYQMESTSYSGELSKRIQIIIVANSTHCKLEYKPTMPVNTVLGQFNCLPQNGFGVCGLALLLEQFCQHACCLKLDVVEPIDRLREAPLRKKHHMTQIKTLFTFYEKVDNPKRPFQRNIYHKDFQHKLRLHLQVPRNSK